MCLSWSDELGWMARIEMERCGLITAVGDGDQGRPRACRHKPRLVVAGLIGPIAPQYKLSKCVLRSGDPLHALHERTGCSCIATHRCPLIQVDFTTSRWC